LLSARAEGSVRDPSVAASIYAGLDDQDDDNDEPGFDAELRNTQSYQRAFEYWLRETKVTFEEVGGSEQANKRTISAGAPGRIAQQQTPPEGVPILSEESSYDMQQVDPLPHIIASINDFFDNYADVNRRSSSRPAGRLRLVSQALGSYRSRFESDPRFAFVRHAMNQLVVVRDEDGKSQGIRYLMQPLRPRLDEKIFDQSRQQLIELYNNVDLNRKGSKRELARGVSAELDSLENKLLALIEPEQSRWKKEPRKPRD
jgi:hypothetical protein